MKNVVLILLLYISPYLRADVERSFFPKDYASSRSSFRKMTLGLENTYPALKKGLIKVESRIDNDLTIDYLLIPAKVKNRKLLILSSGIHGVEAYAGAAVIKMFVQQILPQTNLDELAILLIHSLNPYGFKYHRRVSENNIDLNRNYFKSKQAVRVANPAYKQFNRFLNPQSKVELSFMEKFKFFKTALMGIYQHSLPAMRQAILQGQYLFPQGIYYGGDQVEKQLLDIKNLLTTLVEPYSEILSVDLHTGYGEKGVLHLFGQDEIPAGSAEALALIFEGEKIESDQQKDFYKTSGNFLNLLQEVTAHKLLIPMVFEFGTLNNSSFIGTFDSLYRIITENQSVHHASTSNIVEQNVQLNFLEMFNPPEAEWQKNVLTKASVMLKMMIKRFILLTF